MKLLNYYGDVVSDYICLCSYMLLVIIYVMCIYVVGDYICYVHICCW